MSDPTETAPAKKPDSQKSQEAQIATLTKQVSALSDALKKLTAAQKVEARRTKVLRAGFDQLAHDFGLLNSQHVATDREITEQEKFWSGVGGTSYAIDNFAEADVKSSKTGLWSSAFAKADQAATALELGCNIGLNLRAIHQIRPELQLSAVELNARAAQVVRSLGYVEVFEQSLLDFDQPRQWDLVFIRGVLMHLDPPMLPTAYAVIDKHSSRYVVICENFSEAPEVVPYKGRTDLLTARNFAKEFCEQNQGWQIIDEGWDTRNENAPSNRDRKWSLMVRT